MASSDTQNRIANGLWRFGVLMISTCLSHARKNALLQTGFFCELNTTSRMIKPAYIIPAIAGNRNINIKVFTIQVALAKHENITASCPCNMWGIIKEINNGRCLQPAMPPVNYKVYIMLHTLSYLKWIVHRKSLAR